MDLNLNESESRYYNDLFTLCDVEKSGKIQYLKATELIRSSGLDNQIVDQVKLKSIYKVPIATMSCRWKHSQSTRHRMQNSFFLFREGQPFFFSSPVTGSQLQNHQLSDTGRMTT